VLSGVGRRGGVRMADRPRFAPAPLREMRYYSASARAVKIAAGSPAAQPKRPARRVPRRRPGRIRQAAPARQVPRCQTAGPAPARKTPRKKNRNLWVSPVAVRAKIG